MRSARRTALAAPVVLLAALAAGCGNDAPPPPPPEPPSPILEGKALRFAPRHPQLALLRTTAAAPGRPVGVDMPARLVWSEERTQRIASAFAGRITQILADVGQHVVAGQVLARLASPDFGQAQAEGARAGIDLRLAQRSLARQHELFEVGIAAGKDVEQAEADLARAQAEASRAAARVRLYGVSHANVDQQLALTSGIAGTVVERTLNPGQELRPDAASPVLFVISDPSQLWVQIDAREAEVASLRPGTTFELRVPAYPGQRFVGHVSAVADVIDPSTRTIKVRGVVDNAERLLKAEMLATAHVERQVGPGVVVPASAVILRGERHWVFVQSQPGAFELREVRVSHQGPTEAVVAGGLEVGDAVVSDNVLLLARQFRIAQDDAATPAPGAASRPPLAASAANPLSAAAASNPASAAAAARRP